MRSASPLSIAERVLIAAYVSGLNACTYCHGIHSITAEACGNEEGTLRALFEDIKSAPIDSKMKPILAYVQKLTRLPTRRTKADARAVYDAGWNDQALYDAISVCALFNFMNRFVEGIGIVTDQEYFKLSGTRLSQGGYAGLLPLLEG